MNNSRNNKYNLPIYDVSMIKINKLPIITIY